MSTTIYTDDCTAFAFVLPAVMTAAKAFILNTIISLNSSELNGDITGEWGKHSPNGYHQETSPVDCLGENDVLY